MRTTHTKLDGVLLLSSKVIEDSRGLFFESYNHRIFSKIFKRNIVFVQDIQSSSMRGVLRGLHFQSYPEDQGKLVRCLRGSIWDVVVDLRQNSPTLGQWMAHELSAENYQQLWIPTGFAHGFLVRSEDAEVLYKVTRYWSPEHEVTLAWNDPALNIKWPLDGSPILSEKDRNNSISFIEFQQTGIVFSE